MFSQNKLFDNVKHVLIVQIVHYTRRVKDFETLNYASNEV